MNAEDSNIELWNCSRQRLHSLIEPTADDAIVPSLNFTLT